jgi:hypothetical protein
MQNKQELSAPEILKLITISKYLFSKKIYLIDSYFVALTSFKIPLVPRSYFKPVRAIKDNFLHLNLK